MNTTKTAAIAILIFLGANSANAATPAWMDEGFVMEEVVATAEAPAHLYMEEIVVTAKAPDHLYMEEIVVTAKAPAHLDMEEIVVTATAPVMEEVVATASLQDVRNERLARLRFLRLARLDRS